MHQAATQHLLTFAIGQQRFGIALGQIEEIIRAVRIMRLPKAPAVVEGLIDLRGRVVVVVDIRARFGLPARSVDPADHIVLARAKAQVIGLRVDRTLDVVAVSDNAVEQIDPSRDYVAGVAKLPDGLLLIHDLATFLSDAEARELAKLAEEEGAAA